MYCYAIYQAEENNNNKKKTIFNVYIKLPAVRHLFQ